MASVDTVKLWTTAQSLGNHDPRAAPCVTNMLKTVWVQVRCQKYPGAPEPRLSWTGLLLTPEEQSKPQYTRYDSVERVNDYVSGEIVRKTSSVQ